MKLRHLSAFGATFLLLCPGVQAASRVETLADRLVSQADDLAAESYRGFVRRDRGTRADVDALYLVQQFGAGATLFRRMVADRRPESELRDSVVILSDLLRGADRFSFGRRQVQDLHRLLDDMSRELGTNRSGRDENPTPGRVNGRMRWRGMVDGEVQIFVQDSEAKARAVSGALTGNPVVTFTSGLPRRRVTVEVAKVKGRGSVDILQQPSADNDFTAVVRIRDPKGGASDYDFEIIW